MGLRVRISLRTVLVLVTLAGLLFALRHRAAERRLHAVELTRNLGGQFKVPLTPIADRIRGTFPPVSEIRFLGPGVGDESVDDIIVAASELRPTRISFMETRLTIDGQSKLRTELPEVTLQFVTPVMQPRTQR